jgi:hypothetical protein
MIVFGAPDGSKVHIGRERNMLFVAQIADKSSLKLVSTLSSNFFFRPVVASCVALVGSK